MNERDAAIAIHDDPTVDTIALLQQEIERLEAELLARDPSGFPLAETPRPEDDAQACSEAATLRLHIQELTSELAARDETLTLLLEQAQLLEEAAAADRSEWEQLHKWVEEVERRVEADGADGAGLVLELERERQRSTTLAAQIESDRRAWVGRKHQLEEEIDRLREACRVFREDPRDENSFATIEEENLRLRARCLELEDAANVGEAIEVLRERLEDALAKMDAARVELRRSEDQRLLERNQHEAIVTNLKSQLARQTLQAAVLAPENGGHGEASSAVEADMRIRAFREHLKELHERDEVERSKRGLASKLSRLWGRTGPSR